MSIKPIDIMMAITQSQNLKAPDPNDTVKHGLHAEVIAQQNLKNKESVTRIPDEDSQTEMMDTIKHGMSDHSGEFPEGDYHDNPAQDYPEKALLDEDNGNSIDVTS